jgi:hypothetical protein
MPVASPGAPPGRVFYGRTVVTAAGLVLFMAYGTQYAPSPARWPRSVP